VNASRVDAILFAAAIILASGAAVAWRVTLRGDTTPTASTSAFPSLPIRPRAQVLREAARVTVGSNLFRLSRSPADVRFARRVPVAAFQAAPPPRVRPRLVLKGIVGGPPWRAILDGLPGAPPGTIVATGGVFETLTIAAITRDTVVVQGADTTWRLTLSRGTP
jgi:hypothetical protein